MLIVIILAFQYPKLNNLCFPGKKTFNNLDSHFLEKRTKALNVYMMVSLCISFVDSVSFLRYGYEISTSDRFG